MTLNPDKTTFQLFSLSTKHHDINLRYKDNLLKRTENTTYLGLELDSKLKWTSQIQKAIDRGDNRAKLLKRLAGTTWGATQDVLCTAYKTYVRPAVEYGCEALITTSETNSKKLDVFQNRILRLITGGTKSTPIAAMELQSGLEPLYDRRSRKALGLAETILRRRDNFMSHYWPAVERLKTQRTYLSCIKDLHDTLDFPSSLRLPFPKPWCPLKI